MKLKQQLLTLLFCTALLTLNACSSPREMRLHGKMTTVEHMDGVCWIFVDDNHNKYEVITPSYQVLKKGLQMSIKAVEVNKKTFCNLPTVIEILEYRPDFAKDM